MGQKKKNDNSDAMVMAFFLGVMAVMIAFTVFADRSGPELHGQAMKATESNNTAANYLLVTIVVGIVLLIGVIWSVVRFVKGGGFHGNSVKKQKEVKKSKEELEREELIHAAQEVSEKRMKERELLQRGLKEEEMLPQRRVWDEDEEDEEEVLTGWRAWKIVQKLMPIGKRIMRMPIQGKIVIGAAMVAVVSGVVTVISKIISLFQ